MTAIRERGETPFNEAGDGVILRFSNSDLKRLQAEFGSSFLSEAHTRLESWDLEFMEAVLKHGAKRDGQPVDVAEALDNIPLAVTSLKLLDALYVSYHGKTFQDHLIEVNKIFEEAMQDGPPTLSPDTTTSTNSDTGLSETGSIPRSSGTSARARSGSSSGKSRGKGSAKPG